MVWTSAMKKGLNLRLIIFFTALTFVLTAVVIIAWEQILRPPYFAWVERKYPGPENAEWRGKIEQRVEHFFISMTVDLIVVGILLALVGRQQRRLFEAHERLAHNEKIAALGQVAAQVAHEVKNPLAGMLLYAMHLKEQVGNRLPADELAILEKIIKTINHLTRTVDQVMNFARPAQLAPRPLDLNQVLRDVLQLAEPQLAAARIETELVMEEAGATAVLDESSMRAVLMNLVLNAVQAMPGGGRLGVATRANGARTQVLITDTGAGMDSEQLKKVFEPFYTTKRQGLGLGMAYARKVVEQQGGTIRVESKPGEGTTVEIEVPAPQQQAKGTEEG
jgi:two-component system, NtrC family, sensor histidine kinase HydH